MKRSFKRDDVAFGPLGDLIDFGTRVQTQVRQDHEKKIPLLSMLYSLQAELTRILRAEVFPCVLSAVRKCEHLYSSNLSKLALEPCHKDDGRWYGRTYQRVE